MRLTAVESTELFTGTTEQPRQVVAVELSHTPGRDYYDRNRDRFLTAQALRRGVDPFDEPAPADVLRW